MHRYAPALLLAALTGTAAGDITVNLGRGPVNVQTPAGYDPGVPAPLLLVLHGYSSNGAFHDNYMGFGPLVDEFGFLYAFPDGTFDNQGFRYWNATDACCNFDGSSVDDSAYLADLISEISAQLNVDARRIYLVGHSNGGFMSYRMSCDHAETIAAIASLAGATYFNVGDCTPSEPVHALQIHGTNDNVIFYDGGSIGPNPYPSAMQSAETWAVTYGGCDATTAEGEPLNLDAGLAGKETSVLYYADNCLPGGGAEVWTINQGQHSPSLSNPFSRRVTEWLYAHPKPLACPGDANADGLIDISDLSVVLGQYGTVGPAGDLNADLLVDLSDLAEVLAAFGDSCP